VTQFRRPGGHSIILPNKKADSSSPALLVALASQHICY